MKEGKIDVDELKRIQVEILTALHWFCAQNGINYSLACGTLIGAVRHKGFIPWDDDIDVCMLRSEYLKLEQAFPQLLDGKYRFCTLNRDMDWGRPWGKIQDTRTVLNEKFKDSVKHMGIGIDVFPMDDVPEDWNQFLAWNKKRKRLVYCWSIKGMTYSSTRSIMKNLIMFFVKVLLIPFSLRRIAVRIDKYIQEQNNRGLNKIFESCDSLKAKKYIDKSDFESFVELEFEGGYYKAMAGYDDYLRCIYGDYMELPPEENRVSHHTFEAYWK